jgi:hypothetical protein
MHLAIATEPLLPEARALQRFVPVLLAPLPVDRLGGLRHLRWAKAYRASRPDESDWELLEPSERGDGSRMVREVAIMVKEVLRDIRGRGGSSTEVKGNFS